MALLPGCMAGRSQKGVTEESRRPLSRRAICSEIGQCTIQTGPSVRGMYGTISCRAP